MMERMDEQGQAQESSRGGVGSVRGAGAERSQKRANKENSRKGGGQKPQEDCRGAAQCTAATPWASQEAVNLLIKVICGRYGQLAIGWGDGGIRYRKGCSYCGASSIQVRHFTCSYLLS